jgi:two-component sensor histidine kinase
MDIAVPLGLIVNEIVSNSLKYAFPGGDKGVIRIKLYREDMGKCAKSKLESKKGYYTDTNFILIVADDGVGMPESFNLYNSGTLGIQLVVALVDQLGGKLELARDLGTKFVIRFTVAEKQ